MNAWLILAPFLVLVVVALWPSWHRPHKVASAGRATCPRSLHAAKLTILHDQRTGEVLDITRCDQLRNPNHVTCSKRCVDDLNIVREGHLITDHPHSEDA